MSSAALLILSFPDFDLWPLAWVALAPLFIAVTRRRPLARHSFMIGWLTGALFFYGSCYWLTYPMIHYGGIPFWLAYALLVLPVMLVALFPAACCFVLARACALWGCRALFVAPFLWTAFEWARLGITGQLWNAIGYSQAYVPSMIQAARVGGVYAVGFLIVTVNAAVAYALLSPRSRARALAQAALPVGGVALTILILIPSLSVPSDADKDQLSAVVVAVQPNVIPNFSRSATELETLVEHHFSMSERALRQLNNASSPEETDQATPSGAGRNEGARQMRADLPRVVIWPESPMNFTHARDARFRELLKTFTRANHTSVLFNSLEPAPHGGAFNAAVIVNEEGRLVAQYDKIRLMPFGEYVPLPQWLPGAGLVRGIVGEFTPGTRHVLMPLGEAQTAARAGVFICIESAFPSIARNFTDEGADVLINISNDAYQGRTAVMRQHLANSVFRAVENNRPVLRVTNTGITARISPRGEVVDATEGFEPAVRTWTVTRAGSGKTFYTRHGDIFAATCALISLLMAVITFIGPARAQLQTFISMKRG